MCAKHFNPDDIIVSGSKKMLKPESIPSIFDVNPSESHRIDPSDIEPTSMLVTSDNICLLKEKISDLTNQIKNMRMQFSSEIQKLNHDLDALRKRYHEQGIKLNQTRKELERKKTQNSQFENIIQDLRDKKYISKDDQKFFDVCWNVEMSKINAVNINSNCIYNFNVYFSGVPNE